MYRERERERERDYTMGLSGLPRNMKHELCKFCRSQRILSPASLDNKTYTTIVSVIFCGNPRRKPSV